MGRLSNLIFLIYFLIIFTNCEGRKASRTNEVEKKQNIEKAEGGTLPQNGNHAIISDSLKSYIGKELAEYSIPDLNDYFEGWEHNVERGALPYFVLGDFNGDKKNNYALLLVKGSKIDLIIFTVTDSFNYQIVDSFQLKGSIDIIISLEEKGKWEAIGETKWIPNDGILVSLYNESDSFAYYWNKKKYVKFLFH